MKIEQSIPSLDLAFDMFMLDAESRRLTSSTKTFYEQKLGLFFRWCQTKNITYLDGITPHLIRAYLVHLQQRGLADHTQHAAARAIRTFLNFCVTEELLTESPMRKVRMPRLDKRILPAFEPEDVQRLLDACQSQREKTLILFLLDTGCRNAECIALNVGNVDLKSGAVEILQGKGRKDRVVYLGTSTRKQMMHYFRTRGETLDSDPLWVSEKGGTRLTSSGLIQVLRRLGKRAEVDDCTPHTFRRTFALWSLRNGMNIYALQRLMGHSDLTVLMRYLALVENDLEEAHRSYGAVDGML